MKNFQKMHDIENNIPRRKFLSLLVAGFCGSLTSTNLLACPPVSVNASLNSNLKNVVGILTGQFGGNIQLVGIGAVTMVAGAALSSGAIVVIGGVAAAAGAIGAIAGFGNAADAALGSVNTDF
ncbi:MAG: hypothetical protein ABW072_19110 [Sedimenticola sp.]